jgi:uncharacterized protein YjgD (DUF1641 family)
MYFTAIANNGQRKVKENLDNFNELQEFMNKMEKRGFLKVEVSSENKVIVYNYNGEEWER